MRVLVTGDRGMIRPGPLRPSNGVVAPSSTAIPTVRFSTPALRAGCSAGPPSADGACRAIRAEHAYTRHPKGPYPLRLGLDVSLSIYTATGERW